MDVDDACPHLWCDGRGRRRIGAARDLALVRAGPPRATFSAGSTVGAVLAYDCYRACLSGPALRTASGESVFSRYVSRILPKRVVHARAHARVVSRRCATVSTVVVSLSSKSSSVKAELLDSRLTAEHSSTGATQYATVQYRPRLVATACFIPRQPPPPFNGFPTVSASYGARRADE